MPLGEQSKFDWPPDYRPHIVGSLPYERMLAAFKSYKLSLNVNTVTHSPTMCARRVFEISATGTPVLSGDSAALRAVFGDLIPIARDEKEARDQLARLLGDAELRERTAHAAMREVFAKHTYTRRVDEVLRALGLPTGMSTPSVSIILPLDGSEESVRAIERAVGQSWSSLQLVIAPCDEGLDPAGLSSAARAAGADDVIALPLEGSPGRAEALNRALDAATGQLVALMDPACDYEEHYLEDLVAAFTYTDAPILGKGAHYAQNGPGGSPRLHTPEAEHAYTDTLHPATLVVTSDLARRVRFDSEADDPASRFLADCLELGERSYAADRFSFLALRHAQPLN
jgi:hypothetical protein